MELSISNLGIVCALGNDKDEVVKNISVGKSGISVDTKSVKELSLPFGFVDLKEHHIMRCYTLIDMVIAQMKNAIDDIKNNYDLSRIGVVIGTSNTGVGEAQYHISDWIKNSSCPLEFSFDELELGSPAIYIKKLLGVEGPVYSVSTACSSSAKVFNSARRLIENGICDVVIVGGVDSYCPFTQNGFNALESISHTQTLPMSKNRSGINLGEGCALFIMQKKTSEDDVVLLGVGESSDAYHLTHPEPNGVGAEMAMRFALEDAGLKASDIDYINMHGTGTVANDSMESKAIFNIFEDKVVCASTKSLTGHCLGASGALELGLSWLMLKYKFVIPHFYDGNFDDELAKIKLATGSETITVKTILSNSFAFGGSNASVILGVKNG